MDLDSIKIMRNETRIEEIGINSKREYGMLFSLEVKLRNCPENTKSILEYFFNTYILEISAPWMIKSAIESLEKEYFVIGGDYITLYRDKNNKDIYRISTDERYIKVKKNVRLKRIDLKNILLNLRDIQDNIIEIITKSSTMQAIEGRLNEYIYLENYRIKLSRRNSKMNISRQKAMNYTIKKESPINNKITLSRKRRKKNYHIKIHRIIIIIDF